MKAKVYISANPGQVAPLYGVLVYFETFEDGAVGDRLIGDRIVDSAGNVYDLTDVDAGGPSGAGGTYACVIEDVDLTGASPLDAYAYYYTPTTSGLSDTPLIDVSQMQTQLHGSARRDNVQEIDGVVDLVESGGGVPVDSTGGGISGIEFDDVPIDATGPISILNFKGNGVNGVVYDPDTETASILHYHTHDFVGLTGSPTDYGTTGDVLVSNGVMYYNTTTVPSLTITDLGVSTLGVTTATIGATTTTTLAVDNYVELGGTGNGTVASISGLVIASTETTKYQKNRITWFDDDDTQKILTWTGGSGNYYVDGPSAEADMGTALIRNFSGVNYMGAPTPANQGVMTYSFYKRVGFYGSSDDTVKEGFYISGYKSLSVVGPSTPAQMGGVSMTGMASVSFSGTADTTYTGTFQTSNYKNFWSVGITSEADQGGIYFSNYKTATIKGSLAEAERGNFTILQYDHLLFTGTSSVLIQATNGNISLVPEGTNGAVNLGGECTVIPSTWDHTTVGSTVSGSMFFDTTTSSIYIYNSNGGGSWRIIGSVAAP